MIAGSLIMFGMIAAQFGAFVWWIDREVVDPDQLAAVTTTVVRDPEFRAAVAPEVVDRLIDENNAAALLIERDVIVAAVVAAMAEPAVVNAIGDGIHDLVSAVLGSGNDEVTVELTELYGSTIAVLSDIDPALATELAALDAPSDISLDVGRFPNLATPASLLSLVWLGALGVGGSAALLGVLIHPRPAKALRRVGVLGAVGAGIQLGLAWIGAEVVALNVGGSGIATAGGIGLRVILAGWRIQSMVQLVACVAIVGIGHVLVWLPRLASAAHPAPA